MEYRHLLTNYGASPKMAKTDVLILVTKTRNCFSHSKVGVFAILGQSIQALFPDFCS